MMFKLPPAVKNIIILNVLMLLATWASFSLGVNLDDTLALHYFESPKFKFYQYVTYMFMHGGFFHLFFNMYALFLFGAMLEKVWGSKRFLIFYFITGIGAALIYTFVNYLEYSSMLKAYHAFVNTPSPELFKTFIRKYPPIHLNDWNQFMNYYAENATNQDVINIAVQRVESIYRSYIDTPMVGASGAVFGVLLGFGMLFPNTVLMLLFPPIPIKAKYFVMIYGGIELYLSITQPGSQVAHIAHVGGMIFGYFMIKLWEKDRQHFY